MVRHEERVEAGLLSDSCAAANRRAVGLRTHVANCDSEFHCDPPATSLTLTLKKHWQARVHPVKLLGHWRRQTRGPSILEAAQAIQPRRDSRRGGARLSRGRL